MATDWTGSGSQTRINAIMQQASNIANRTSGNTSTAWTGDISRRTDTQGAPPLGGWTPAATPVWPGSYGSSGSSGPTDEERKAALHLDNISEYNQKTLIEAANAANKAYDISDQQNKSLKDAQIKQARLESGNDWFKRQRQLQSVLSGVKGASGNAMQGAGAAILRDMLSRIDDMGDTDLLNTLLGNINNYENNYYEALMNTVNARNELDMKTTSGLRDIVSDWAAQRNNIDPKLAEDFIMQGDQQIKPPGWLKQTYTSPKKEPVKAINTNWMRDTMSDNQWQQILGSVYKSTASGYENRSK